MDRFLSALVLGAVEGLTEFLPVSSTGHLILVNEWVKLPEPFAAMFNVFIQMGAILAVILHFRARLSPFGLAKPERDGVLLLWGKVAVATLPAVVLGLLLDDLLEAYLMKPAVVAAALVVYGVALVALDRGAWKARYEDAAEMPWRTAFLVGLVQCLALVPGTSRSAATILGALMLGATRKAAAEFSFFLAVPTLCGASLYSLLKYREPLGAAEWTALGIGFATAFAVAWFVVAFFMDWVSKRDFRIFGWYRIALGAGVLAYFFLPVR